MTELAPAGTTSFDAPTHLFPGLAALALLKGGDVDTGPGTALVLHKDVVLSNMVKTGLVNLVARAFPGKGQADRRAHIAEGFYSENSSGSPTFVEISWFAHLAHRNADPAPRAQAQVLINGRRTTITVVPLFVTGLETPYLKQGRDGVFVTNGNFQCVLLKPWGTDSEDQEDGMWRAVPLGLLPEVVLRDLNMYSAAAGKGIVAQIRHRLEWSEQRMEWTPNPPPARNGQDQRDRQGRLILGFTGGKRVVLVRGQGWEQLPTTGKGDDKVLTSGVFSVNETATMIEVAYLGLPKDISIVPTRIAGLVSEDFPVDPWRVFGWTPDTADESQINATRDRLARSLSDVRNSAVSYCRALGLIHPDQDVNECRPLVEKVLRKAASAMHEELRVLWEQITQHLDLLGVSCTLEDLVGANTRKAVQAAKSGWRSGGLEKTAVKIAETLGRCDPKVPMHRKACAYLLDRIMALNPPLTEEASEVVETEAPAAPVAEGEGASAAAPEAVEGADANPPGDAAALGDSADTNVPPPPGEDASTAT